MRSLAYAGVLALLACKEVLPVGTERLPPPEVEVVTEGETSMAVDPCGVLAVSPPVRLSGTATDSTRPAIGVLGADGDEPVLLVMWTEVGESVRPVHARMLLADGSFLGPLAQLEADGPTSISIMAVDSQGSFAVALADAGDLEFIPLFRDALYRPYGGEQPIGVSEEWGTQRRWVMPGLTAPRGTVLSDRVLVAALGPDEDDDGEADTIQVLDFAVDPSLPAPCPRTSAIPAAAVDIVADGDGARLVWVHEGNLYGAELTSGGCSCLDEPKCEQGWWDVPSDTAPAIGNEGIIGTRIRSVLARGNLYVAVPRAGEGAIWQWRGADEWATMIRTRLDLRGTETFDLEPWEEPSFAIGVEPSHRRLALTRPVSESADAPAEIEIARDGFEKFEACGDPLRCLQLSADLRASHEPEMAPLADGFAVVWSDEEADGQREIYYAKVTCAPLVLN